MTHEEILDYNWDDGVANIWPAVDDPQTEGATALLIFWRSDGPALLAESKVSPVNQEARRMAETVRDRILAGFYRQGATRYDPIADRELTRVQVELLRRSGMPEALLPRHEQEARPPG